MRLADRRFGALIIALLLVGTTANAQPGGGGFPGGGGGGRGGGGGGGGSRGGGGSVSPGTVAPPASRPFSASQVDLIGVVKEIGPADRITIQYEEAPALTLPAGERSFVVAKTSLLKGVTVGEQVRFRLDSQEVSVLAPFDGDRSKLFTGLDDRAAGGGRGRFGSGRGPGSGAGP